MKKTTKRPYCKPEVDQVDLVIEEAVLAACKNPSAEGKRQIGCRQGNHSCKHTWTGS